MILPQLLTDDHGRTIRKLRVSLTDRCNLRCHYCMPVDTQFMDDASYLAPDEIVRIVQALCDRGLKEVRLTGGEPLMRRSFDEIVEKLAALPLEKIGLTTNGVMLDRHLEPLKLNRVNHLNISLDSLNAESFAKITHGNHLPRILNNLQKAIALGFQIKINVVALKGINDHEIFDFVEFSAKNKIELRFLELMRIGHATRNQRDQYISAQEMIDKIRERFILKPFTMAKDSTSFNYKIDTDFGEAQIGFIASESKAFCGACSRWRLSSDGILRSCLLKDEGLSVAHLSAFEMNQIFNQTLGMKPAMRPAEVSHAMNAIGG
jgi:cyclic pyranopterin phosphate synthase